MVGYREDNRMPRASKQTVVVRSHSHPAPILLSTQAGPHKREGKEVERRGGESMPQSLNGNQQRTWASDCKNSESQRLWSHLEREHLENDNHVEVSRPHPAPIHSREILLTTYEVNKHD